MGGYRKGFKRADKRWVDDTGREWDSRFEWLVYTSLQSSGYDIRRCDGRDTVDYGTPVRNGLCLDCSGDKVLQKRTYTSDLYVMGDKTKNVKGGYLLELKGYWQPAKRTLFRYISKQCVKQGISLRIVFESGNKLRGSQLTGPEYVQKYCKEVIPGVFNKKTKDIEWFYEF